MKKTTLIMVMAVCAIFANAQFLAVLDKYTRQPVQIDFEQRTYWHVRERESRVRGKIILGEGNKFNISTGRMTYISNGETFWEYNNRQRQVTVQKITPSLSKSIPTELLKLLRSADFTESTSRAGNSVIWQDEHSRENGFDRVEVFYTDSQITRIITNDIDSNITTFTFDKVVFLPEVSDDVFNFVIPQGAQVHER